MSLGLFMSDELAQLMNVTPSKKCTMCGDIFPATTEYFFRNISKRGGISQRCKICDKSVCDDYRQNNGELLFEGRCRGIAGNAIRETALEQLSLFDGLIRKFGLDVKLVGVGGLGKAADVRACLDRGCGAVQFATAAMLNPGLGLDIRRDGF